MACKVCDDCTHRPVVVNTHAGFGSFVGDFSDEGSADVANAPTTPISSCLSCASAHRKDPLPTPTQLTADTRSPAASYRS